MYDKKLKYFFIILFAQELYSGQFSIKKIECLTFDPEFLKIDLCQLVPYAKDIKAASIIIRLLKLPVTNADVRVMVERVSSPPFIVLNHSWDACAFMRNQKTFRALGRLFRNILPFTNINHTCPYNNLSFNESKTLLAHPLQVPFQG
ncbi:uncharacterized protein LOC131996250 [Stomoxys calcitrans]|uniref:uncharacterized protein LOC131996250 n=1 Tax=Stomoxys calcitrans TaxID=35570 RepID=UPI0027E248A6|nr:uncharacterized protein LOC131996250 [Stomoxys calcitrans]